MREIQTDEFEAATAKGVCLIDFHATWCGPCRAIAPTVQKLADAHEGRALIAKVDIDAEPKLAARFGIRGVPTFVALRDGETIGTVTGADPKRIAELLERALNA